MDNDGATQAARESTPEGWTFLDCVKKPEHWTAIWDTTKPGDFRYAAVAFEGPEGLRMGLRQLLRKMA